MVNRHSYSQSRSRVYATVDIREGQLNVTRMICHHGLVVRRGSKCGAFVVATRLATPPPAVHTGMRRRFGRHELKAAGGSSHRHMACDAVNR